MKLKKYSNSFFYCIVKTMSFFFSFFPYKFIHFLANILGSLSYFFLKEMRKITLSNIAMAKDLNLNNKEIKKTAKKSFQNLAINILEYLKFSKDKHIKKRFFCHGLEKAKKILKKNGLIFFCGHIANWEVLFLDGNLHMKGIALAKPIKNKKLYNWIVSIREKTGGEIIHFKKGIKNSLKALKEQKFVGLLSDQSMPKSNYTYPFLGQKAFFSKTPALLSYKTNTPIIVATIKREKEKYYIYYSDPIWPNKKNSKEKEVFNILNSSFSILESFIKKHPCQFLWQHNLYKCQTPTHIYKKYRKDSILIIFENKKFFKFIKFFKEIYPKELLIFFIAKKYENDKSFKNLSIKTFKRKKDLFIKDYRFKLVYNFTKEKKLKKHFQKFSAIDVIDIKTLIKDANKNLLKKNKLFLFSKKNLFLDNYQNFEKLLKTAIIRK